VQLKGGFYLPNETLPLVSCTAKKSRREKQTAQAILSQISVLRRERERNDQIEGEATSKILTMMDDTESALQLFSQRLF